MDAPPPILLKAVELSKKNNTLLRPLDMREEEFSDIYCDAVSFFDLWRKTALCKKITKKGRIPFSREVKNAEEYAIAWDEVFTRREGFRKVEMEREKHMAESMVHLLSSPKSPGTSSDSAPTTLFLLEVERWPGIKALIETRYKIEPMTLP